MLRRHSAFLLLLAIPVACSNDDTSKKTGDAGDGSGDTTAESDATHSSMEGSEETDEGDDSVGPESDGTAGSSTNTGQDVPDGGETGDPGGSSDEDDENVETDPNATDEDGAGTSPEAGTLEPDASLGEDPSPLPDTPERFFPLITSGSRLKARVFGPAGADPVFLEWWDSELELVCAFSYAEDGSYRCLPQLPPHLVGGYLEPTCDEESTIVNFWPNCAAVAQAQTTVTFEPQCEFKLWGSRIWTVEPIEQPATHYEGPPDSCEGPLPLENDVGGSFARLRAPLPVTSFVAGELTVVSDRDHLGVQVLVTEDGARLVTSAYDPRYGECEHSPLATNEQCTPKRMTFVSATLFSDAACNEPAVVLGDPDPCGGPSLRVAVDAHGYGRGEPTTWGAVGETLTGTIHRKVDDTCEAVPVSEALTGTVRSVHRVDPNPLLPLDSATRGDGPLRTLYKTRADGVFLTPGVGSLRSIVYFESATGARCRPIRVPGGGLRCMPATAAHIPSHVVYGDENCTRRVTSTFSTSAGDPRVLYESDPEACADIDFDGVLQVYEAGAPFQGPTYASEGETCYDSGSISAGFVVGPSVLSSLPDLNPRPLD